MRPLLVPLLIALALAADALRAQTVYQAGDIVDNFTLLDRRTGQPMSLTELEGKILFLDFFAHWCPFCNAAAPELEANIYRYYRDRGGNAAGVPVQYLLCNLQADATARDRQATDNFVARYGNDVIVLQDTSRVLQRKFTSQSGQPTFAIINGVAGAPSHKQWELVFSHHGYRNHSQPIAAFQAAIDSVKAPVEEPPSPVAIKDLQLGTDGTIRFFIEGNRRGELEVQATSDLTTWTSLGQTVPADVMTPFEDLPPADTQRRFYRVVRRQ